MSTALFRIRDKEACPCCGAQFILGIWFPRRKAEIMRKLVSPIGRVVKWSEFENMKRSTFNVHTHEINEFFLPETDYRIKGFPGGSSFVEGGGGCKLILNGGEK